MVDWWTENGPPVYIAVAAYLGMVKPSKKSGSSQPSGNLNELLKMAGPGGMLN